MPGESGYTPVTWRYMAVTLHGREQSRYMALHGVTRSGEQSREQSSTRRHARPHLSTVGGVQEMADVNDTQQKVRVYTEDEINEMLQQALRIRLYKQPAGHPLIAHAYVHGADWSWNVGDMEAVIQAS